MELLKTMPSFVLTGHGGLERPEWCDDLPASDLVTGESLVKIALKVS